MTGFIVSVFPFRNRVSSKEAFEGLELGEGKPSRPVLRGPGGRKAAWLLGSNPFHQSRGPVVSVLPPFSCRLQLPVPLGLNLVLMPGEHVLRRDVTDGAVQADVVVMLYLTPNQTPHIF